MKVLKSFLVLILSFQLHAGVTSQMLTDAQSALDGQIAPKPGDTYQWAGGTLTRNADNSLTYVNSANPNITQVISSNNDLQNLAQQVPDIKQAWIDQYGVNALATQADYSNNTQAINNLLSKAGAPGALVNISGTGDKLQYDSTGVPYAIIKADGTSSTIDDYMKSNAFNAAVGTNDSNGSAEYVSTSASNPVPENFNGQVQISKTKNADGSIDVTSGIPSAAGGDFNRDYNGIAGVSPATDPLSDTDYSMKSLTLAASIWGITEVGEKMCKPIGKEFPHSLVNWWLVLKNYIQAEKTRNSIQQSRQAAVNGIIQSLTTSAGGNSSIQLEGIKEQIELYNIEIDSISGSSMYSADTQAQTVRNTSRLAWREEVLSAVYQGIEDSKKEDAQVVHAYVTCSNNVTKSLSVASAACTQSTKDCARTKQATDANGNPSIDSNGNPVMVPDPVPGSCDLKTYSCEMRDKDIPLFQKISLQDLATLYNVSPIPSKEMNTRLLRVLKFINYQVNVLFPKSNNSKYDWTTPLQSCVDPLLNPVKNNGVICPANASDKNYDKKKFEVFGKSDDIIASMSHYATGNNSPISTTVFNSANQAYKDALTKNTASNSSASTQNLQNMSLRDMWVSMIKNGSPNFPTIGVAGVTELHNDLTNSVGTKCTPSTCQPAYTSAASSNITLPPISQISTSAAQFLSASGISNGSSQESIQYLTDTWNTTDLYFAQSNIRQIYFQYHEKLLTDLILSDRARLGNLLVQRQKLVDAYAAFKKAMSTTNLANGSSSGGSGGVMNNQGSNSQVTGQDASVKSNSVAVNPLSTFKIADVAGVGNYAIGPVSHGLLTSNPTGLGVLNGKNGVKSFAIGTNGQINKSQSSSNKLQEQMNKLLANNKSFKSPDSPVGLQKLEGIAASNMKPFFNSGAYGPLLSSFGLGGGTRDNASSTPNTPQTTTSSASGLGGNSSGGSAPGSASFTTSVTTSDVDSDTTDSDTNSKANMATSKAVSKKYGPDLSEDDKRLMEAIYARNRDSKQRYEKNENDSIFDQVTKAYIRSYDKFQK